MAEATDQANDKQVVTISDMITVGDLADKVGVPVPKLIGELMKNGIMATVNQKIDFETAQIIVEELGLEVELHKQEVVDPLETRKTRELSKTAAERPPIIAVMGHVDHGKTSLLDAIRGSGVAEGEAGGITQHISAYQIEHNKRKLTFLDTPGHEAFAALREHGAKLTDVAVIVVAADDGIKPQTEEAIKFAAKAGVKIVVALNKIDKEGADVNRVKQQLADQGLQAEDWGGDTITVEVSAKTKKGINTLLDMILLLTDVEELKAEVDGDAEGLIIEAHMEQGRGPVATVLVEHGHLKQGQVIVAGNSYAKIRTLQDYKGDMLKEAGPSTPATLTGFKTIPRFGDVFSVVSDEKTAKKRLQSVDRRNSGKDLAMSSSDLLKMINKNRTTQEVSVIVKADVQGSLKSVIDSLNSLTIEELAVRVVGSGVGNISESDVTMAASSGAIIYGFGVEVPVNVKQLAAREEVTIRVYNIIYELIDDAKELLSSMLSPEIVETEIGKLIIKGIFRTTKEAIICGGEVTKGKAVPKVLARVIRAKEQIAEVVVESVKRQQQEAKEVLEGEMCGLQLKTDKKILLEEGDRLEFFTREEVARTL